MFGASRTNWTVANLTSGIPHLTVCTHLVLRVQVLPSLPPAQPRILDSFGMRVFFLCSKHAFSFLCYWICCYPARLPCASQAPAWGFQAKAQVTPYSLGVAGEKVDLSFIWAEKQAMDRQQVAGTCLWMEDGCSCWFHVSFFKYNLWVGGILQLCYAITKEMSEKSVHVFVLAAVCNLSKAVFLWA